MTKQIKYRLEYLRGEIEAERISYLEIAELQSLVKYIDPEDTLLLEWAGVPEGEKLTGFAEGNFNILTGETKITKEKMINEMVQEDVEDIGRWISEGDTEFLEQVLKGEGWKGYNQLTYLEVVKEYQDRLNNKQE